ncbi:hypothetical protein KM043_010436 [Ampulex compressa]|nr:hypothetical protein KM043_010436 [Ampulex compressa]
MRQVRLRQRQIRGSSKDESSRSLVARGVPVRFVDRLDPSSRIYATVQMLCRLSILACKKAWALIASDGRKHDRAFSSVASVLDDAKRRKAAKDWSH